MKVETLSEKDINAIGHAFGYYEYAQGEKGLVSAYSSKDAVVSYINGYVEMVLQAGTLVWFCIIVKPDNPYRGFFVIGKCDNRSAAGSIYCL